MVKRSKSFGSDIDQLWISFEQKEYGDAEITTIVRCLTSKFNQRYIYFSTKGNGFECCVLLSTPDEISVMKDRGLFSECQEVMGTAICREFVACGNTNTGLWLAKKSGDNTKLFSKLASNIYSSGNQHNRRYVQYATVHTFVLGNSPVIMKMKPISTRKNKNQTDACVISLKK
ncbi:hypothetical protein DPMN_053104 [Dreissena polymorpha]|uniref:Uncharacterized protein n=1 Tax=Dreissena polymorpha TaxID=45954 RepID=A0A9D4CN37_DREPO|nr:hypothetical protein DPMN_053104 [Dreissena polymorpha]